MPRVYKILPQAEWDAAVERGVFAGSGIDLRDGFIHLSTGPQARRTAQRFFAGRDGLVLVAIEAEALGGTLVFEAAGDGERFPHVYGAIPMTAVAAVYPLPRGGDGRHLFPGGLDDEMPEREHGERG
jgi:uncharacterized protein (DUF952 family)